MDDPRWMLVERILATREFQRSTRSSDFLRHVCQLTLEGKEETISEQYLGKALFGRSPDYDSAADTIVRSHALRLRRRLEYYFQREGKGEPLRLVIPRGGYIPLFVPAEMPPEEPAKNAYPQPGPPETDAAATPAGSEPGRVIARYRMALVLGLCIVLGLVGTVIYQWQALDALRAHAYHDRNHPLWSRLFNTEAPTRIVLGDSGLVLFHAAARRYVSLDEYVNNNLRKELPYVQHADPDFALLLASRRYTSLTDAMTAIRLLRLPEARPDRVTVSFSRDMNVDDFKTGNLVLIGAQEADPWVELFERQMDFVFSIDSPDTKAVFLNKNPQKGEASVYRPHQDGPEAMYAVVAFLPNLSGTGNVLLLEGLNMAGTESAADLILDDRLLLPALAKVRRPDGSIPHFEMMLATGIVKNDPGVPRVVALHIHR